MLNNINTIEIKYQQQHGYNNRQRNETKNQSIGFYFLPHSSVIFLRSFDSVFLEFFILFSVVHPCETSMMITQKVAITVAAAVATAVAAKEELQLFMCSSFAF